MLYQRRDDYSVMEVQHWGTTPPGTTMQTQVPR